MHSKHHAFKLNNKSSKLLIITGPRSVGKTTLGKELHTTLGFNFFDLDDLVNEQLSGHYAAGDKTPLEQAMDQKRYDLIEDIVRKITTKLLLSEDTTIIAFSGGAYVGYSGLAEHIKKEAITVGLLPYQDRTAAIELLTERESNREHFVKLLRDGALTEEDLKSRIENDFDKVSAFLENGNVDQIVLVQRKTPAQLASEVIKLTNIA